MDKKLTFLGGEPNLNIDDILRDPVANRAALFGLLTGIAGATDAKISVTTGITPGVEASTTAGYVWLNGEILQVEAATVPASLGNLFEFQKVVTYDPNGDKVFNDAVPRQTWQKNRAELVNVAAITGMNALAAPDLITLITAAERTRLDVLEADTGWLALTAISGATTIIYGYARQVGKVVSCTCVFSTTDVSGGDILELPAQIDPPATPLDFGFSFVAVRQVAGDPANFRVRDNRRIGPLNTSIASGVSYEFSFSYVVA